MAFFSTDNPAPDFISLAEAATRMPGQPHISTLHRWRLRGVRGVRLQTTLIGGRRFVTPAAVAEFMAKINEQGVNPTVPDAPGHNLSSAESFLDREGV